MYSQFMMHGQKNIKLNSLFSCIFMTETSTVSWIQNVFIMCVYIS